MPETYHHKHRRTVTVNNGTIQENERTFLGDSEIQLNPTIPASASGFQVLIPFTRAQVRSYVILAKGALTLRTNNNGTPQETIAIEANKMLTWDESQDLAEMHFSGDITQFFFDNGATSTVDIEIRVLIDATPSTP